MDNDKALENFNEYLDDCQRIASELLVVLVHRVGWTDDQIDWTHVEPMTEILSQLEQVQQTIEAATGNRRPSQAAEKKIKPAPGTLVETPPPVSQRWFSQPTREDS